jgi:hypothetical protein
MRLAILGTRGVPAAYSGFEALAEELGSRLVERGHAVTVYGRPRYVPAGLRSFRGIRVVTLPTVPHKYLDTWSPAALDDARSSSDSTLFWSAMRMRFHLPASSWREWVNVDGPTAIASETGSAGGDAMSGSLPSFPSAS